MKPKKKKKINCQIDVEAPAYVRTARYAPGRYAFVVSPLALATGHRHWS